jgi:hypothetical protein
MDFGMWPEEFKEKDFDAYVASQSNMYKTTNGVFAPWMMYKENLLTIGGHDPIMHSCREDSDIFNRMSLAGYTFVQPWNSLVYHLTGRGAGSFDGDKERHRLWQMDMEKSTKEFIRKWGSNVKHTELMHPIIIPKYNIAFVVDNCTLQAIEALEPWCDRLYIKDEMRIITTNYIEREQPNTKFDLSKRILTLEYNDPKGENDIIVEFDARKFSQQSFNIIQQLPEIIKNSGDIGEFELDIFKITINSITEYQNDLIVCDTKTNCKFLGDFN